MIFISFILMMSCGNGTTESTTNTKEKLTETKPSNTKESKTKEPLGDPCQISASEIAAIIGWEDYNEGLPNAISSEKQKVCDYSTNLSGALSIAFFRHDDSNPEGKYLERAFNKTPEGMTYQDVSAGLGDQAIYSFGKNGPNYVYNMRWRFGNHTEKRLFLRSPTERNPEETLEQLKAVATKIEQ